ncbi:MAG: DUF86 domain-containing protein [Cyanobacteriota bacterium]|nr:DUF86 domain-containing protein [Cyanobacteriota bacterium]
MTRDLRDSLLDVLDAIAAIERFTAGVEYESFVGNEEKIFAVEKAFEIIGEAVKNVPQSIRSNYPEIPWKNIAGMRDKLAHQYWNVDVNILWKAIAEDLPQIKATVVRVLEALNAD